MVQWLRLRTLKAGDPGWIPRQGTRSHTLQLRIHTPQFKILHAATKVRPGAAKVEKEGHPIGCKVVSHGIFFFLFDHATCIVWGFPGGGSDYKESACNVGDLGSTPELGRSPGEENGCPLQYSCLGNPIDKGAWWPTVLGVVKSRT